MQRDGSVWVCAEELKNVLSNMCLQVVRKTNLHQAFVGSGLDIPIFRVTGFFPQAGGTHKRGKNILPKQVVTGFQDSEPEAFVIGVALPCLIQVDSERGRVPKVW